MSIPILRLRQPVQFPANVYGDTGIAVTKANGNYTIETDWSQFSTQPLLPSSPTNCFLNYDTVSKNYVLVPTTSLKNYIDSGDAASVNSVKYTAQSLSSAQQTQARQNVYAAPLDALAYNGMQINGSMEVSQELNGSFVSASGKHICDGWRIGFGGTMAINAFADGGGGSMFYTPYRLAVTVTTAQASLAAGDYVQVIHRIEGWRVLRLQWGTANAQPITIGFWTSHHRTGVYSVAVANGANNRSYVTSYTQVVADTAQYNVVTIPGDTLGAWAIDNTVGLQISFTLATGSTYTASAANTWTGSYYLAAPGQVNGVAATSDIFRITGVVILPGIEAPSAERSPFIMRPYDQELVTCQRYWQKSYPIANPPGTASIAIGLEAKYVSTSVAAGIGYGSVSFVSRMRAAPTINIYSYAGTANVVCNGSGGDLAAGSAAVGNIGDERFQLTNGSSTTLTVAGGIVQFHWTADARL